MAVRFYLVNIICLLSIRVPSATRAFVTPDYMPAAQMERIYNPLHAHPVTDSLSHTGKNVVILIVERMGKEYIGSLNPDLDGISSMLGREGYSTAFFHGGHNISMGFSAYAHSIGYERYYGLDEYCMSKKYGGMDDWDSKWAIWDEPFLQFTLDGIEQMKQPFLATVFTASSHHPYNVPEQYRDSLKDEGGKPIHKCVRYTDLALRRFFERASRQPWYRNTIFVLVADHTNQASHDVYKTDLGLYSIPIIFYTPDGTLAPAVRDDIIVQQTDITPTVLHLVGYSKPYLAFGDDVLSASPAGTWAFNYNAGVYQLIQGDLLLQFDGTRTTAVYRFKTDKLLKNNLVGQLPEQPAMEQFLKALIQQYMSRMNENRLICKDEAVSPRLTN